MYVILNELRWGMCLISLLIRIYLVQTSQFGIFKKQSLYILEGHCLYGNPVRKDHMHVYGDF